MRIEIKRTGILETLKAPGVLADLDARARRIAAAAGEGMEPSSRVGRNRARASVVTASYDARRRESRNMDLTKAIDAGRS